MSSETLSEVGEPAPRVAQDAELYLVLECDRPLAGSSRHSLAGLDEVTIGRGEQRRFARAGRRLDLTVPDARMSTRHGVLRRTPRGWEAADAGSKNGTHVDRQRLRGPMGLSDGDVLECGRTFFIYRVAGPARPGHEDLELVPADATPRLSTLIGSLDAELRRLLEVARSSVPILIQGETGTGKEIAARAVHEHSRRRGAFVAVNSGALPVNLVEAELFGARRGAYSGAVEDRPGLIRAADGGTLLLDEIGDLPLGSQPALLRALQEHEVLPVGGTTPVPVDLRLVASTHHDLRGLVERQRFRADLFARLSGFTIHLPPLRERREDLGLYVASLLRRRRLDGEVRLGLEAARLLFDHDWPQNVRELAHCLETAAALAEDGTIRPSHLPATLVEAASGVHPTPVAELSPEDAALRERLIGLLEEHHGNISAVARGLGRQRVQVHRWMRRFGLRRR